MIAGYANTPQSDKDKTYGSRSKYLLNFGSAVSELSYNGFSFPPAIKSRLTVVPEYDTSGRVVKYLTLALEVEFIMSEFMTTAAQIGTPGVYGQISFNSIRELMAHLCQPGQVLKFDAQGFGQPFRINDNTLGPQSIIDIDGGPKPQVVEMKPLGGGNAFLVTWLVVSRISPLVDDYDGQFVSFVYKTDWEYSPSHLMIRSITGKLEVPLVQNFNQSNVQAFRDIGNSLSNVGFYKDMRDQYLNAKKYILKKFPRHPEFNRTYKFTIDEARKTLDFTIVDTQMGGQSWLPPGVGKIEFNQSFDADWKSAFVEWNISFSGSMECIPDGTGSLAVGKQLAWYWLWKILTKKRKDFLLVAEYANDPEKVELPPGTHDWGDGTPERYKIGTTALEESKKFKFNMWPVKISFTDECYGNNIDFDVVYKVICTTSLLNKGLAIFLPLQQYLRDEGLAKDSWIKFIESNPQFSPEVTSDKENAIVLFGDEILVDICNSVFPSSESEKPTAGSDSDGYDNPLSTVRASGDNDVLEYKNNFHHYEDNTSIKSNKLIRKKNSEGNDNVEIDDSNSPGIQAFQGDGSLSGFDGQHAPFTRVTGVLSENPAHNETITATAPCQTVRYVIMEGSACRFSRPVTPPLLLGIGGAKAIKDSTLGMDKVSTTVINTGLRNADGTVTNVYKTVWRRHYVLDGVPANSKVYSTGIERRFA